LPFLTKTSQRILLDYGHTRVGGDSLLSSPQQIQECIDSCTQAANSLRSSANTLLFSMERNENGLSLVAVLKVHSTWRNTIYDLSKGYPISI